jgi:hypothetical protein
MWQGLSWVWPMGLANGSGQWVWPMGLSMGLAKWACRGDLLRDSHQTQNSAVPPRPTRPNSNLS